MRPHESFDICNPSRRVFGVGRTKRRGSPSQSGSRAGGPEVVDITLPRRLRTGTGAMDGNGIREVTKGAACAWVLVNDRGDLGFRDRLERERFYGGRVRVGHRNDRRNGAGTGVRA